MLKRKLLGKNEKNIFFRISKYNLSKPIQGYSLIYAIIVVLIVTTFTLLLLSYSRLNNFLFSKNKKNTIARLYSYQGLIWLDSFAMYDQNYTVRYEDGYTLHLLKKNWGAYDLYYSTVTNHQGDTLFSKIALVGYQKDTLNTLALYLKNTNTPVYLSERVDVTGKCFLPSGVIRKYGNVNFSKQPVQILPSGDTLLKANITNDFLKRISTIQRGVNKTIGQDTLKASFNKEPVSINGDTVFISGFLEGNIIIYANTLVISSGSELQNVVLIANAAFFPDNFKGNMQLYASGSIIIGKNAYFNYPTIIALLPEMNNKYSNYYPVLSIDDSITLFGEIYAYSSQQKINQAMAARIKKSNKIVGSIYASCNLDWHGNCFGPVICDKMLYSDNSGIYENMLGNLSINIDSLPPFFVYSSFFPLKKQKKILQWLN